MEMILETDMAKHFEALGRFRSRALSLSEVPLTNVDDKMLLLKIGLKCADTGHSSKKWELHYSWSSKVVEEFFLQGD